MKKVSRIIAVGAVAALALAAFAGPAAAHRGKGKGKKAMGTIASFDGTTLTVTTTDGETLTATFTEDTRVKVEHRGHHDRSGKPSHGDAEDLTAGTFVLKMKTGDDGSLEKIRIRSAAAHEEPAADETDGTDGTTDGTDGTTDGSTDGSTDGTTDGSTGDTSGDTSGGTTDGSTGDATDATA